MNVSRHPGIRAPWSRSDRAIPRSIVRPLQQFLSSSTSSGLVLLVALAAALLWANSPWRENYERLWRTPLVLRIGQTEVGTDLNFWIGGGLMTVFFLLVGMEIKREITSGELRRPRAVALPAVAALGGMIVPALIYLAVVGGGEAARGWAIPTATDIALALGALALASRFVRPGLKPLLLTLAIVDDIGAIVVVSVFYASGGTPLVLAWAPLIVAAMMLADRSHIRSLPVYVVLGAALWYVFLRAGIQPTIAGVVLGLLAPAVPFQRPVAVSAEARRIAEETLDDPDPPDADAPMWLELAELSREAVSPIARLERTLLVWSGFVIVPLFVLANAGVRLSPSSLSAGAGAAVAGGIVLARLLGKPLGVVGATRLATWSRIGALPADVDPGQVLGLGVTAGIGFTVSLFVADLAFADDPALLNAAKVGIMVAAVLAGVASWLTFRVLDRRQSSRGPR
jgi:NhaA family Na+:H+ antiporter